MNSWTERLESLIHYATEACDFDAAAEYREELAAHLAGGRGTEDDCVCQAEGY